MHLNMVVLAERLGMKRLEKNARKQLRQAIRFGGREGFWKAIESGEGLTKDAIAAAEEFLGI
jgi:hypothetical protein